MKSVKVRIKQLRILNTYGGDWAEGYNNAIDDVIEALNKKENS